MTISALVCAKTGEYLQDALESLQAQTHPIDQIVVSLDCHSEVCVRSMAKFFGARVVHTAEATGLAHAFNAGLRECTGDWVLWQDDDDISEPDRVARLAAAVRPDLGVIGSRCSFIAADGTPFEDAWSQRIREAYDGVMSEQEIAQGLPRATVLFPNTTMIQRSLLLELGGLRHGLPKPGYQLLRRMAGVTPMLKLPLDLLRYRQHAGQMTRQG